MAQAVSPALLRSTDRSLAFAVRHRTTSGSEWPSRFRSITLGSETPRAVESGPYGFAGAAAGGLAGVVAGGFAGVVPGGLALEAGGLTVPGAPAEGCALS